MELFLGQCCWNTKWEDEQQETDNEDLEARL